MKNKDTTNLIVKGTTWFSGLAILNLCWLLFSLPLVTLIPATDAVFEVLNQWETNEKEIHIFECFRYYFKKNFWKSFKWGLPLLIMAIIIIVDIYFLSSQTISAAWFQVYKYAFYTLAFLFVLAVIYGYPLSKQKGERHIRLLFIGVLLAVGNPITTLTVIGGLAILGLVFWYWPAMLFFFSLTGMAWIGTKAVAVITKKNNFIKSNSH